jgi:hypothetical protein
VWLSSGCLWCSSLRLLLRAFLGVRCNALRLSLLDNLACTFHCFLHIGQLLIEDNIDGVAIDTTRDRSDAALCGHCFCNHRSCQADPIWLPIRH